MQCMSLSIRYQLRSAWWIKAHVVVFCCPTKIIMTEVDPQIIKITKSHAPLLIAINNVRISGPNVAMVDNGHFTRNPISFVTCWSLWALFAVCEQVVPFYLLITYVHARLNGLSTQRLYLTRLRCVNQHCLFSGSNRLPFCRHSLPLLVEWKPKVRRQ